MQKNPRKIILLIAIVLMLIPPGFFALIAINLFQQFSTKHNPRQASAYETAPAQSSLTKGTVDTHPTFLSPGHTFKNMSSSQSLTNSIPTFVIPTITPTSIPTVQPSRTPKPTPTPLNGSFTIQIISYPQQTNNNTVVSIEVRTHQPNAILQLDATYNLPPYFYQISNQVTDFVGNATIYWSINLYGPMNFQGTNSTNSTVAHFYISGNTPKGKVATSPMQSIQVLLNSDD